ncbi:MAG: hypothetical protein ACJAVK_000213 [Akkermansiaceae bacterium]|jgi:hypothetical protein
MFLVSHLEGQVVVPGKGWRKIAKGEGEIEGMKKLGVWDNENNRNQKGDVMVAAVWGLQLPEKSVLLDLPPRGVVNGALIFTLGSVWAVILFLSIFCSWGSL